LAAGDDAQRARFVGAVAGGTTGTLALADARGVWNPNVPPVSAERAGEGWRLRGTTHYVVDGDRIDEIAVLASTLDGPQAFIVPAADTRAERSPSFDLFEHVADVTFDGVTVTDDRRLTGDAVAAFTRALEDAAAGLSMVMVGACQRALDIVVDYAKRREQFGVPIGSFQAVKHKAVDVHVAIERARALAYFAALTAAEGDPRRSIAVSMAKAAAGDMQNVAFRHCIQLFGGLGFTWENDVHLFLRRAKAGELLFGGAREHRVRVGRELLTGDERPGAVVHAAEGCGTLLPPQPEAPKGGGQQCD
ncbi:MAG TPA: acyl-CoA dehydrogenase, partial [Mycobacteriales bacterium]|nr:acyl-CoA dehydrogenase [Mycobacteriales bacterium]